MADPKPSSAAETGRGKKRASFSPAPVATGMEGHFHPQPTKAHTTWTIGEKSHSRIRISLRRLSPLQTFHAEGLKAPRWPQAVPSVGPGPWKQAESTKRRLRATVCIWKHFPFSCLGKGSRLELGGEKREEKIFYL